MFAQNMVWRTPRFLFFFFFSFLFLPWVTSRTLVFDLEGCAGCSLCSSWLLMWGGLQKLIYREKGKWADIYGSEGAIPKIVSHDTCKTRSGGSLSSKCILDNSFCCYFCCGRKHIPSSQRFSKNSRRTVLLKNPQSRQSYNLMRVGVRASVRRDL